MTHLSDSTKQWTLDYIQGIFDAFQFLCHRDGEGYYFQVCAEEKQDRSIEDIIKKSLTREDITPSFQLLESNESSFKKILNWIFKFQ